MATRNCLMCIHCEWNEARQGTGGGCETCGYGGDHGDPSSLLCKKGHFKVEHPEQDKSAIAADINKAATCPDFAAEPWAQEEAPK